MFTNLNEYKPSRNCFKACPPGEYCVCRNLINNQIKIKNMTELEKTQEELINLLYNQVIDLTMMSKIELGDDVIKETVRLQTKIKQLK
jgi:hypothetical protein